MKTILLKFAGPLQAWGTDSHFETRHTDFYPSKSALIGIIAASLGYKRDEDAKIQKLNELSFGVRIDQVGTLLKDYHTVKKYKADGRLDRTYVTNRYYLEDAVFLVAISHEDDAYIDMIKEALDFPYFQTFMGRRSLPMCADFLLEMTDEDVVFTLQNYEWQAAKWYQKKYPDRAKFLEIYLDSDLSESGTHNLRRDRVISFSQKERKFAHRYESRINTSLAIHTDEKYGEHDIWDSVGE